MDSTMDSLSKKSDESSNGVHQSPRFVDVKQETIDPSYDLCSKQNQCKIQIVPPNRLLHKETPQFWNSSNVISDNPYVSRSDDSPSTSIVSGLMMENPNSSALHHSSVIPGTSRLTDPFNSSAYSSHYIPPMHHMVIKSESDVHSLEDSDQSSCSSDSKNVHANKSMGDNSIKINRPLSTDLLQFLESDYDGKIILSSYKRTNKLPMNLKNLLVRKIIGRERDKALAELEDGEELSNFKISSKRFQNLANDIGIIFNENPGVYYIPYCSDGYIKTNASGKLLENYNYVKKCMKDAGILMNKAEKANKKRELHLITDDEEYKMQWLKENIQPWKTVASYWEETFNARRKEFMKDSTTVFQYFERFKCLRQTLGPDLLQYDFARLYPGKQSLLFDKWDSLRNCIKHLIEGEYKPTDVTANELIQQLPHLSRENQDAVLWLLLTYIITPSQLSYVPPKKRQKTKNFEKDASSERRHKKPSQLEMRQSFILQVESPAELETTLQNQREELRIKGLVLQPLIVFVGPMTNLTTIYVIVDDVKFEVESALHAVDLTFKLFQVTDCAYPQHGCQIWLFIQKLVYEIVHPGDKFGVKLNVLIGLFEKLLS